MRNTQPTYDRPALRGAPLNRGREVHRDEMTSALLVLIAFALAITVGLYITYRFSVG